MLLKRLTIGLLFLALAAAAAYAWRWQQAQETGRAWVNQLRPFGILRSASVWPTWDSRRIEMRGVLFEPVGAWQKMLQAPIGYRVQADRLILTLPDERHPPSRYQMRAIGIQAPILPTAYPLPDALKNLLGQDPPSTADLQLTRLNFDAMLDARHDESSGTLQFTAQIFAPGLLRLYWDANLVLSRADWQEARFDRAGIDAQTLEIADLGYFTQSKEIMAARARTDVPGYEAVLIERLQQQAETGKWTWSAASSKAAHAFIQKPDYLRVTMAPLSTVALPNLGLYAPGDRFALFNLKLDVGGAFNHPAPAERGD